MTPVEGALFRELLLSLAAGGAFLALPSSSEDDEEEEEAEPDEDEDEEEEEEEELSLSLSLLLLLLLLLSFPFLAGFCFSLALSFSCFLRGLPSVPCLWFTSSLWPLPFSVPLSAPFSVLLCLSEHCTTEGESLSPR